MTLMTGYGEMPLARPGVIPMHEPGLADPELWQPIPRLRASRFGKHPEQVSAR